MLQVSTAKCVFLVANSHLTAAGTQRGAELRNPKPQGIRSGYGPFRKQGGANGEASCCGTCTLAFWL